MAEQVVTPSVKWAQRKAYVFIIIEAADVGENKVVLTPDGTLKFTGKSADKIFECEIHLMGEVDVE